MFGKQKNLYDNYKRQSAKINQILFTKIKKDKMIIQIIVFDSTLIGSKYNLQQQEIDAITQVYQLFINNDQQSIRLLRMLKGYSGIQKFLSVPDHWLFDKQKRIFKISNFKTVFYQHQATKNKTFDVFTLQDILCVLRDKTFIHEMESKYLINKALQIISNEKQGKRQIDKEQILKNKEKRQQQLRKKRQKRKILQIEEDNAKNFNQLRILNYIRKDSYNFDSFNIDGLSIIKQHQKEIGRCLFGCVSIDKKNSFTIKIDRISKQNRNPVFWLGVVDLSFLKCQNMEQIMNVIAMSDQKKIMYVSELNKKKKITPKNKNNQFNKLIQFEQRDIIKVQINQQLGVITWANSENQEIGSHQSQFLKLKNIQWVPFMEVLKIGDCISWCQ